MKTPLLVAALGATTLLSGCIIAERPTRVVTVRETTGPVVYQPGYTVDQLSPGYRTVRVRRNVYYVDRDTYYQRTGRGYVVVAPPY